MKVGDRVRINRATWGAQAQARKMSGDPFRHCRTGVVTETDPTVSTVFLVRFETDERERGHTQWVHEDYLIPDMLLIAEMP